MNGLTEDDYRELFDYIKENLIKCEADDIVQQLQELETASVIEKIDKNPAKFSRKGEYLDDCKIGPLSSENPSAEYRFRAMSGKELYRAVVDILETRLISGPEIAVAIPKSLWGDSSIRGEIVWKYENVSRSGEKRNPVDIIEEFGKMSDAERKKIKEIISVLKNVLGEETT